MKFGEEALRKKLVIEASVGIVILARYSSRRLPGKALLSVGGKATLDYVLERLCAVVPREQIILATSQEPSDDALADFAKKRQLTLYRGSLSRVAERYWAAAQKLNTPYVARINGDNIFLDTQVLLQLCRKAATGKYRFLSNVKGRSYPRGMSVEITAADYYQELLPQILASEYYTEHVMPLLYERADCDAHFYLQNTLWPQAAGLQWALDTPEDLERCRWMVAQMKRSHLHYGLPELLKIYQSYEKSL